MRYTLTSAVFATAIGVVALAQADQAPPTAPPARSGETPAARAQVRPEVKVSITSVALTKEATPPLRQSTKDLEYTVSIKNDGRTKQLLNLAKRQSTGLQLKPFDVEAGQEVKVPWVDDIDIYGCKFFSDRFSVYLRSETPSDYNAVAHAWFVTKPTCAITNENIKLVDLGNGAQKNPDRLFVEKVSVPGASPPPFACGASGALYNLKYEATVTNRSSRKLTFNLVTKRDDGSGSEIERSNAYLAAPGATPATERLTFDFVADRRPGRYFVTLEAAAEDRPFIENVPTKAIDITRANCTPQIAR